MVHILRLHINLYMYAFQEVHVLYVNSLWKQTNGSYAIIFPRCISIWKWNLSLKEVVTLACCLKAGRSTRWGNEVRNLNQSFWYSQENLLSDEFWVKIFRKRLKCCNYMGWSQRSAQGYSIHQPWQIWGFRTKFTAASYRVFKVQLISTLRLVWRAYLAWKFPVSLELRSSNWSRPSQSMTQQPMWN